jgi:bacterioferritin (cytochrome b1)
MGEKSKKNGTLAMLKLELEREQQAIKDYAGPVADILNDMVTLEMLEEQLFDEIRHAGWLKRKILELKEGTRK